VTVGSHATRRYFPETVGTPPGAGAAGVEGLRRHLLTAIPYCEGTSSGFDEPRGAPERAAESPLSPRGLNARHEPWHGATRPLISSFSNSPRPASTHLCGAETSPESQKLGSKNRATSRRAIEHRQLADHRTRPEHRENALVPLRVGDARLEQALVHAVASVTFLPSRKQNLIG
jgi:hypothetical protein